MTFIGNSWLPITKKVSPQNIAIRNLQNQNSPLGKSIPVNMPRRIPSQTQQGLIPQFFNEFCESLKYLLNLVFRNK